MKLLFFNFMFLTKKKKKLSEIINFFIKNPESVSIEKRKTFFFVKTSIFSLSGNHFLLNIFFKYKQTLKNLKNNFEKSVFHEI